MQYTSASQTFGATNTKTKICNLFVEGRCPHQHDSMKCKFAHGMHELRASEGYYKTSLCRFWLRGHCADGALCRHAHGREELRQRGTNYRQSELEKVARKHGVPLETLIEERRTQRLKEDKGEVKVDQRTIQFNMQAVNNSAHTAAVTAAVSHMPTGCHTPMVAPLASSPSLTNVSVDESPLSLKLARLDSFGSSHSTSPSPATVTSPSVSGLAPQQAQQLLALLVMPGSPAPPAACGGCVAPASPLSSSASTCVSPSPCSILSLTDVRAGRCTIQEMLQSAKSIVDWNPTELYED